MPTWKEGDRFVVGDTIYQWAPPEALTKGADVRKANFFIFKSRSLVERCVSLIAELFPRLRPGGAYVIQD